eukprot:482994_1
MDYDLNAQIQAEILDQDPMFDNDIISATNYFPDNIDLTAEDTNQTEQDIDMQQPQQNEETFSEIVANPPDLIPVEETHEPVAAPAPAPASEPEPEPVPESSPIKTEENSQLSGKKRTFDEMEEESKEDSNANDVGDVIVNAPLSPKRLKFDENASTLSKLSQVQMFSDITISVRGTQFFGIKAMFALKSYVLRTQMFPENGAVIG